MGNHKVSLTCDPHTSSEWDGTPITRLFWRYQIQGPKAWALIEKFNGGPVEGVKFFHMTTIRIAGREVEALRHGMAGAPGLEIWGSREQQPEILAAILEAGKEFDLKQVGSRSYASSAVESGWLGPLLPAIYSSESTRGFREWLPALSMEAFMQLGGSFHSDNLEDYYKTPFDLNYEPFISLNHDFIGPAALEKMMTEKNRQHRKVTLEWNPEDVARIFASLYCDGPKYKSLDLPMTPYAFAMNDTVTLNGKLVGLSVLTALSYNINRVRSLASIDRDVEIGSEVVLVWGQEPGVYSNIRVEPHKQLEVRAIVCPSPYTETAKQMRVNA